MLRDFVLFMWKEASGATNTGQGDRCGRLMTLSPWNTQMGGDADLKLSRPLLVDGDIGFGKDLAEKLLLILATSSSDLKVTRRNS